MLELEQWGKLVDNVIILQGVRKREEERVFMTRSVRKLQSTTLITSYTREDVRDQKAGVEIDIPTPGRRPDHRSPA